MAKKIIEVSKAKVRVDSKDLLNDYISMMNGIVYACSRYGKYRECYRNQIAVDLTVGSYMLGLDAFDVLNEFICADLVDPVSDDEEPSDRVDRVLNYTYRFDWDWMIDPDDYTGYQDLDEDDDYMSLFFKLVD